MSRRDRARRRTPSLELHIESLSLQGFDARDQDAVGAALETQLSSLFLREGIPPSLRSSATHGRLVTPDISLRSSNAAAGESIARALYSGLAQPAERRR